MRIEIKSLADMTTVLRVVEIPETLTEVIYWIDNAGYIEHKLVYGVWLPGEENLFTYNKNYKCLFESSIRIEHTVPVANYFEGFQALEKKLAKAESKIIALKRR